MSSIRIETLSADPAVVEKLGRLLVDVVAGGGSVSFMHPLDISAARDFWRDALDAAGRGKRVVFGAWLGDDLAGTVTLIVDLPPNQPHRAEIAKMMTHPSYRGRGVASSLLQHAEAEALRRSRTLLVLDTATEGGASALYERLGYHFAGEIPDFALKPLGGLTGTRLYWKQLIRQ